MCNDDHSINIDVDPTNEGCQDFFCRICDSTKFEPVTENDGMIGDTDVWTTHYVCSGCSVHFQDPQKFSKPNKERES